MKKLSILLMITIFLMLGSLLLSGKQNDIVRFAQKQCQAWGLDTQWIGLKSSKSTSNQDLSTEHKNATPPYSPEMLAENAESQLQATSLLTAAEQRLKQYYAVQANIHQVIFMNGVKYYGEGDYVHSGEKRLRVKLQLLAGESTGELLQVSDGQLLWTEYKLGPIPPDLPEDQLPHYFRVERRNLGRIEERLNQTYEEEQARQIWDLGAGGLCALIASFRENLEFTVNKPQAVQNIPCYVLSGTLNKHMTQTASFLLKKRKYIAAGSVPTRVVIYLEQTQLFPLRYEYYHQQVTGNESPLLQVEFSQVVFNGAPDLRAFIYNPPPGYFPHDVTKEFLERIKITEAAKQNNTAIK